MHVSTSVLALLLLACPGLAQEPSPNQPGIESSRVVLNSHGWELVGDLRFSDAEGPVPAVLMLNQAAGDRTPYRDLARHLANRGVASLSLDLRGHGESTNLGPFVPGEHQRDPLIWDAEKDVIAAHEYLKSLAQVNADRIGMIGASYSGEEMAEAGRLHGYAQAYVALSPGSFSAASISGIDSSGVPWLFSASNEDRFVKRITASVQSQSQAVELLLVPGTGHGTDILLERPDVAERVAVWMTHQLR